MLHYVWLEQEYQNGDIPATARAAWTEYLAGRGIASVGGGLLVAKPCGTNAPTRTIRDAPPISSGPVGESLESWLRAQILLGLTPNRDMLLDIRLAPAQSLHRVEETTPSGQGRSHFK